MTNTDPIKALVGLLPDFDRHIRYKTGLTLYPDQLELLVSTIKPMADVVTDDPFPIFSDRLRVRREECDEAEVNIDDSDILALAMDVLSGVGWKAPPASPAPVDDGELVERVAKAIYAVKGYCYTDDDRMFQAYPWDDHDEIIKEGFRTEARAALAAIKEGE